MRNIQNCSGQFCQPESSFSGNVSQPALDFQLCVSCCCDTHSKHCALDNIQNSVLQHRQSERNFSGNLTHRFQLAFNFQLNDSCHRNIHLTLSSQFSNFSVTQCFEAVLNSGVRLLFYPLSNNSDFSSYAVTKPSTKKQITFRKGIHLNQNQRLRLKKRLSSVFTSCSPLSFLSAKVLLALTPLLLLPYSFSTQALSATTANTIEGTKPYLLLSDGTTKLTNLNELLGFSMPKRDGSAGREQIDASMADIALTAPSGMTYNDVIAAVTANGVAQAIGGATVGDADGDASNPLNTSITGSMKATWYEGTTVVPASKLGNTLTSCGGPYTLKLEIPTAVNANTTYGAPNTTSYGTSTGVTYTFTSNSRGICYLRPRSMQIWTGTAGTNIKYATGYNAATWDTGKGFKVAAGFPTTGFEKAVFSVIGSGSDQSQYRCSTDSPTKVSLSGTASTALGANCTVTYTSATKATFTAGGRPTITMEYNNGTAAVPNWVTIDSYTIATPSKWAISGGSKTYGNTGSLATSTQFAALDACRVVVDGHATPATTNAQATDMTAAGKAWRQKYLYRRDELTNSPYADRAIYPELSNPAWAVNYYSRDVDGTFMGEWGYVIDYLGSVWDPGTDYWTVEAWSSGLFYVRTMGSVNLAGTNSVVFTVCRGE